MNISNGPIYCSYLCLMSFHCLPLLIESNIESVTVSKPRSKKKVPTTMARTYVEVRLNIALYMTEGIAAIFCG